MTDDTQPEALRLAEILEGDYCPDWFYEQGVDEVSAELRRQHARITDLESQLAQRFDAADMATARAQGFRDGVSSVSAGSEPVAWQYRSVRDKGLWFDCTEERAKQRAAHPDKWDVRYLYTPPSPPEGMAGWQPIETAPKDGSRILLHPAVEVADDWSKGHWNSDHQCWIVGGSPSGVVHTAWHHLPAAPGPADGESNV